MSYGELSEQAQVRGRKSVLGSNRNQLHSEGHT